MLGWVSLYREILDNPIVCKDSDHFAVWVYLLLQASHQDRKTFFNKEKIMLKRGQLITGRKSIVDHFGGKNKINESKVQRILKLFENEQQIKQQTSNKNRLITILNYNNYQNNEQQNEQQVNNERTTSEHGLNTNNNNNNFNNELKEPLPKPKKEKIPFKEIIDYLNLKVKGTYKYTTKLTQKYITTRWNEGFILDDFYKAIDNTYLFRMTNGGNLDYVRPSTIFNGKFEDRVSGSLFGFINELNNKKENKVSYKDV